MKKMFLTLALVLVGSFAFASNGELKKDVLIKPIVQSVAKKSNENVRVRVFDVYCNGKLKGTIICDCADSQVNTMANTMCNG